MRNFYIKDLLHNRRFLYLILTVIIVSVFTLSIAYAILSVTLNISGSSEVVASNWDIHLDNVQVKSGSVATNAPVISGNSSLAFDVELNTPGDYYEFTVDVVNDGSIDAMIDSVVKTPELTIEQAKYIKYEITYENGESISTKQTIKKGTSTPIKVRVEYRKDLVASDLPSGATELNLKLTLIYVQSDGSGSSISNNGVQLVNVVSGDGTQVGNEICIKEECFYVIDNDGEKVTMLSKYNLYIGYSASNFASSTSYNSNDYKVSNLANVNNGAYVLPLSPADPGFSDVTTTLLESPTGIQDSSAKGMGENYPYIGVERFSENSYWNIYTGDSTRPVLNPSYGTSYPAYVYDSNSLLYNYVEDYKNYLIGFGVNVSNARLIKYEELQKLGFDSLDEEPPEWAYSTSYWTGSVNGMFNFYAVEYDGTVYCDANFSSYNYGVRPVIEIPVSEF